uniref:Putative lipocalin lipocalin n=1 Tax=Rhipicephalus microplus TaxID=6941 RepID=A0A6G5A5G2_RHIMP
METLTVFILSVLAMPIASFTNLHEFVERASLIEYQNPWKFIQNHSNAYLLRVSVPATKREQYKRKTLPCVRSRYLNGNETTQRVNRTLDVYNSTTRSPYYYNTTNISLTVKHEERYLTLLGVDVEEHTPNMSIPEMNITLSYKAYTLMVLYSDSMCLILAQTLRTASVGRPWLQCVLWVLEHRILRPPNCCLFIFELLCVYRDHEVKFFRPTCIRNETTTNHSHKVK